VPDIVELLAAYDKQSRAAVLSNLQSGVHAERDGPVIRLVGPRRGFISAPHDLQLDGEQLVALIARQRDFYAARGEAVEWKTHGHDEQRDLNRRLTEAGFVAEEEETVLIGVAADIAADPPPTPAGVLIRQVSEAADLRRIAAMESEVWGEDWSWLADDLIGRVRADADQIAILVAEVAGVVVSAAWLVSKPGTEFGGLWGGSTLAQWRGRGIYRALIARRAQLAAQRGARYLQVDASAASRPILLRLGFCAITTTTPYVWTPPSS
jgi:GNAT superfamily N-acetyltransferase